MSSKWPAYCSHCDTHHFPASTCPPPLDPMAPKADTVSERSGFFRGAKISKPANRGQKS